MVVKKSFFTISTNKMCHLVITTRKNIGSYEIKNMQEVHDMFLKLKNGEVVAVNDLNPEYEIGSFFAKKSGFTQCKFCEGRKVPKT